MVQLSHFQAQNVTSLFNATFSSSNAKELVNQVRLLFGDNNFEFSIDNFSVQSKRPLASGRYEFKLAAYTSADILFAGVVVNVVSQGKTIEIVV